MLKIKEINSENVKERFCRAFKTFVGTSREFSYDEISEITGIEKRTLYSYGTGQNIPELANLFKLARAIGPKFLNQIIDIISFTGVVEKVEHERITEFATVNKIAAKLNWKFAEATEDGSITDAEFNELQLVTAQLIDTAKNINKADE